MKSPAVNLLLLVLNIILCLGLVWGGRTGAKPGATAAPPDSSSSGKSVGLMGAKGANWKSSLASVRQASPKSPFEKVYSSDHRQFAENLRRVGCPESTVKDIILAEVNREYRSREEALRPTPADHVPWGWSPKTSEKKLIERRIHAAAIVREKESALRQALGYEVEVEMPAYALTTSDLRLAKQISSLPQEKRQSAHDAQEKYWAGVEQLRSRTKGFWLPEEAEELLQLQRSRDAALAQLSQN